MSIFLEFVQWLEANYWSIIVSAIISIPSLVVAIILYIKSKKVKLPHYSIRSTNIVRDLVSRLQHLQMLYSGQEIENLTATKIAFWNKGRDTINSQDIASADPLIISIKDGYKILDAKIIYTKNTANQFSVIPSDDRSYVKMHFDYLDKDDGAIIQILHTGKSSKDIEFCGKIKGSDKLTRVMPVESLPRYSESVGSYLSKSKRNLAFLAIILGTPLVMIFVSIPFFIIAAVSILFKIAVLIVVIILLIFWLMAGFMLLFNLLKRRIPKGFEVFEEDF
ncbi:MAG: hypothetical protein PHY36_04435 [Methanocellales archaeon]|nr:hypothetical protein [Methanocellales archaeon]